MSGKSFLVTSAFIFVLAVPTTSVTDRVEVPGPVGNVSGRVILLDDSGTNDLGTTVVWLEGASALDAVADEFSVLTSDKHFVPRVIVVPIGSTVSFPNSDPFNHNVFSRSSGGQFDLGLYGRGTVRSTRFTRPGVVRIYCNVHPGMSALIHVLENRHYSQPGNDGSFRLDGVPAGSYELHAWHERASEQATIRLTVTNGATTAVDIELDAHGYRFVPHENKYGRPYSRSRRRY